MIVADQSQPTTHLVGFLIVNSLSTNLFCIVNLFG